MNVFRLLVCSVFDFPHTNNIHTRLLHTVTSMNYKLKCKAGFTDNVPV